MALPVEPRMSTLFLYRPVPVGPLAKMSLPGELNSRIIEEGKRLRKSLVEGVVLNYSSCYQCNALSISSDFECKQLLQWLLLPQ